MKIEFKKVFTKSQSSISDEKPLCPRLAVKLPAYFSNVTSHPLPSWNAYGYESLRDVAAFEYDEEGNAIQFTDDNLLINWVLGRPFSIAIDTNLLNDDVTINGINGNDWAKAKYLLFQLESTGLYLYFDGRDKVLLDANLNTDLPMREFTIEFAKVYMRDIIPKLAVKIPVEYFQLPNISDYFWPGRVSNDGFGRLVFDKLDPKTVGATPDRDVWIVDKERGSQSYINTWALITAGINIRIKVPNTIDGTAMNDDLYAFHLIDNAVYARSELVQLPAKYNLKDFPKIALKAITAESGFQGAIIRQSTEST